MSEPSEACFECGGLGAAECAKLKAERDEALKKIKQLRIMVRSLGKLIQASDDYDRASGDALCQICGLKLYDHPQVCSDTLHVGCDGKQHHL